MAGVFTISLDYELHWGVFDKRPRGARLPVYQNTVALVPTLLQQFEQYGVHVTWATVGALMAQNLAEWQAYRPKQLPTYTQTKYSAYQFVHEHGIAAAEELAHFSWETVAQIEQYAGQELGTHTFAHFYCCEEGQTPAQFEADLESVQAIAKAKLGKPLKSLVFPRNQFNQLYLQTCAKHGIEIIRSNPAVWYWSGVANDDTSLLRKIARTGDVFLPLGSKAYTQQQIIRESGLPIQLPASRLLREISPKQKLLNKLRLRRIIGEMTKAAKNHEIYHLWWHPENFGTLPQQSMADLAIILHHFQLLQQRYGFTSKNMGEFVQ